MEPQVGDKVRCYRAVQAQEVDCTILKIKRENADVMYYVNFDNLNKRWDAWVTKDCLNLSTLVRASASKSRKGHVNQEDEDAAMTVRYLGEARTIEYLHFADF
jgi:hypothetical protein